MKAGRIGGTVVLYLSVVALFLSGTYWGSRGVSAVAQKIPVEREHTIVIDPGHGGEDGGATSCTGRLESAYNLEIALRLRDMCHLLGYQTVMVRTADQSVYTEGETIGEKKISDLKERVRLVNDTEGAILISLHQNTFSDSRYAGAQVFYASQGESYRMAQMLQTAFCQTVNPGSNRKSKRADGIYLMQHIDCTGVLIECGFLSNPEEEGKLHSAEYQKKLCCVIGGTLTEFLTEEG